MTYLTERRQHRRFQSINERVGPTERELSQEIWTAAFVSFRHPEHVRTALNLRDDISQSSRLVILPLLFCMGQQLRA